MLLLLFWNESHSHMTHGICDMLNANDTCPATRPDEEKSCAVGERSTLVNTRPYVVVSARQ